MSINFLLIKNFTNKKVKILNFVPKNMYVIAGS